MPPPGADREAPSVGSFFSLSLASLGVLTIARPADAPISPFLAAQSKKMAAGSNLPSGIFLIKTNPVPVPRREHEQEMPLLKDEMLGLADKAAKACARAQAMFAERRVADGRRWLMKALYASDQLQRLTMRSGDLTLATKKKQTEEP